MLVKVSHIPIRLIKWGIAQMCLCETKCKGGGFAPCWGSTNLPEKDFPYRAMLLVNPSQSRVRQWCFSNGFFFCILALGGGGWKRGVGERFG